MNSAERGKSDDSSVERRRRELEEGNPIEEIPEKVRELIENIEDARQFERIPVDKARKLGEDTDEEEYQDA